MDHDGQLAAFEQRTLDWADANLDRFMIAPVVGTDRLGDALKPFCELVVAASILRRFGGESRRTWGEAMLARCWREFDDGALMEQILRQSYDATIMLATYGEFHANGYRHAPTEALIARFVDIPGFFHMEQPAHRHLEVIHAAHRLGLVEEADVLIGFNQTWLAGTYPPWTITVGTAYAVTHTVFYMTDWGRRPHGLPERVRDYLREALPHWLRGHLAIGNFDLAAEMLMSMIFMHHPDALDAEIALFAQGALDDGAFRGPDYFGKSMIKGHESDATKYFLSHYHTTLLMLMTAVLTRAHLARSHAQ